MAKLIGLDFHALQVTDLERSRDFYTGVLGLEVAPQGPPHAVVFATTPVPFAIREPIVDLAATDKLGWGVALWFAGDDVDELHAKAVAAGATVLAPPTAGDFGRYFVVADPDGYALTIHQANNG